MKIWDYLTSRLMEASSYGYSCRNKAYKLCNLSLNNMVEIIDVKLDEIMSHKNQKDQWS